jgi:trimeric autotransporter adhesin
LQEKNKLWIYRYIDKNLIIIIYMDQFYGGIILENNSNMPQGEGGKVISYPESKNAVASSFKSLAEGYNTVASGIASHAEGTSTTASGEWSHAEGSNTKAIGSCAHAEGVLTKAMGTASHVEGYEASTVGIASHGEGIKTNTSGRGSHAEGLSTSSSGDFSHAEGIGTDTNWMEGAHIMGSYGDALDPYSWHLANGTSPTEKSLAARISRDGSAAVDGGWITGGFGYAELFETLDGQHIDCGYFVTVQGRRVRRANNQDKYILGVTSAAPAVMGNGGEFRWKNKYLTDEWGEVQYREAIIPAVTDEKGNIIVPEHKEEQPVLNPRFDKNQSYIPRLDRDEWVPVTLIGQVLTRDDGTCVENGYCIVNERGIATTAPRGYRVLERTGPNQILILLKSMILSSGRG